mmetsp:Transcript_12754/g.46659  ORF Transcript_12754/g.46659 Transcript_12754/m.46659 type:complete len:1189 (-) Transcript_12754:295-3861(-)
MSGTASISSAAVSRAALPTPCRQSAAGRRTACSRSLRGSVAQLSSAAVVRGQALSSVSACKLTRAARATRAAAKASIAEPPAEPPTLDSDEGSAQTSKRTDISTIMILGAGPIVIGQACEFDYSGTQACKALKSEGYRVVLVNSNPATIMTDPGTADATYLEPMTPELVEKIIAKERPDCLLPTMGGQTALNLAVNLSERGTLEKYDVELIGADLKAINKAEDRALFKEACAKIGLKTPPSGVANTMEEALEIAETVVGSYPIIVRPAFTLGGTGGGICENEEEFRTIVTAGLDASLTTQVLVEKSLLGWKEYELEVMRDLADNVVIVCSIENLDPMGVHTGDSITIAPAQTLTDKEYQRLRDASIDIIREIGVACGGSNVQFAVNPADGEVMVIEMNPRVSRSSALASKATGFPIAKIAAKLAIGYTLDQIANDITRKTPASFEPSIDYVVTKIPRFAFEKFPGAEPVLGTQMKSVGEAMAFGRTFQESFQKCLRSLETGRGGFGCDGKDEAVIEKEALIKQLSIPSPDRIFSVRTALVQGMTEEEVFEASKIDPWFISQMAELVAYEKAMRSMSLEDIGASEMLELKQKGFSDPQIGFATGSDSMDVRRARKELGVAPVYKRVDTCAAEFEADTPYLYSSYEAETEAIPSENKKVLILGGGPNRIGQGIEFDYCCCHACFALSDAGYESIMLNSNPETVSTDYDTSDRLYFEPLTVEDVLNVIEVERPVGIVVQFGGQTPLKLAVPLERYLTENKIPAAGFNGSELVSIWGTQPDSIDAAEDRDRFLGILEELKIKAPPGGISRGGDEAQGIANRLGYPVIVRPSYVLGGRAMEVVNSDDQLEQYIRRAVELEPEQPILVDKFLGEAVEVDVDSLRDSQGGFVIGGILEHIEQAGVHSGDSACSIPTSTVSYNALKKIRTQTKELADKLNVVGLMNIQYAVQGDDVWILEANPRASRTVPFVAKAVGRPLAKYASLLMSGATLQELDFTEEIVPSHVAVKEAVLPFNKFPGADALLGPEMRSTGEVMGLDRNLAVAFAKSQIAAGLKIPESGTVFISMNDQVKDKVIPMARGFQALNYKLIATAGTGEFLQQNGITVEIVSKLSEHDSGKQNVGDLLYNGGIQLILITAGTDPAERDDGRKLRRGAISCNVPIVTTVEGCSAILDAIWSMKRFDMDVQPLQDYFIN